MRFLCCVSCYNATEISASKHDQEQACGVESAV
jgi:hypothetical protein